MGTWQVFMRDNRGVLGMVEQITLQRFSSEKDVVLSEFLFHLAKMNPTSHGYKFIFKVMTNTRDYIP
jgi:hypothetical protein